MNKLRALIKRISAEPRFERLYGWQVGLSKGVVGDLDQWHFSAILIPKGRSSTNKDWTRLGKMVGFVEKTAGLITEPQTIKADPNAVQHFVWMEPKSTKPGEAWHRPKGVGRIYFTCLDIRDIRLLMQVDNNIREGDTASAADGDPDIPFNWCAKTKGSAIEWEKSRLWDQEQATRNIAEADFFIIFTDGFVREMKPKTDD